MVYTIGETVLDIIFRSFDDVKVKPGGSMLNSAITLGRLGVGVEHISTMAKDRASDLLIEFLEKNGVGAQYIYRSKRIKTSLALAHLNSENIADYTFYKDDLNVKDGLKFPELKAGDMVHFGSFFSINRNVHLQLHKFLAGARKQGVVTMYDPNFRKPHLPMLSLLKPLIEKNISAADIVKGSDEDFKHIFNLDSANDVWSLLKKKGVKILFYTQGSQGSKVYSLKGTSEVQSEKVKVLSTIGAGDTFSAGIIYYLMNNLRKIEELSIQNLEECIRIASLFAAETCTSMDNYLSAEFCKQYK